EAPSTVDSATLKPGGSKAECEADTRSVYRDLSFPSPSNNCSQPKEFAAGSKRTVAPGASVKRSSVRLAPFTRSSASSRCQAMPGGIDSAFKLFSLNAVAIVLPNQGR